MKVQDLFNYQKEAMQILTNAYDKDHLVHAYLFDGDAGTGTIDAAIYMAKKLICQKENSPCLNCTDCKRIDSNSHLNYIYIEPVNDTIKKEQIEALIHDFSMSSLEKGSQVYIIKDADKMNAAASNALLKFLEEPNTNHYAFLTTTNYKRLLATIVSRCQLIHFKPVPKEFLMSKLDDCGVDKDVSYVASFLTSDLEVAMKYIEEGKLSTFLNIALKIVDKDIKVKDPYVEYFRNRLIFLEEKDKNYHRLFLDILVLVYQEILKTLVSSKCEYFENIIDNKVNERFSKNEIIEKLELINMYQERFNYNVNLDLQYTSLFSKL